MTDNPRNLDNTLGDDALVRATLAGNREAFGTLVERHQHRLHHTLKCVLGSPDDASEVLQDALVQAYTKLSTFRGSSQFYTWLYRIALNLASWHQRRHRRRSRDRSVDELKMNTALEPVDPRELPDQELVRMERARIVHAALLQLNEEHRQILVLREMEDCPYESIAEILNLPVGTVRSRIFRARLALKQILDELLTNNPERTVGL